jgi:hypothetical protein
MTADFLYLRWLGDRREIETYDRVQIDRAEEFQSWEAGLLRSLGEVREVYGYFNNHWSGHSPASANEMKRRLGLLDHRAARRVAAGGTVLSTTLRRRRPGPRRAAVVFVFVTVLIDVAGDGAHHPRAAAARPRLHRRRCGASRPAGTACSRPSGRSCSSSPRRSWACSGIASAAAP